MRTPTEHYPAETRRRARELLARGLRNNEIAERLGISPSRVSQIRTEDGFPSRRRRLPPLTKAEADRLAKELGGFARTKTVNGNIYYYAVKNRWVDGKVRQSSLAYLGACADA